MKCSKCGQENKREAKFCTKCGNPLSAPAESVTPSNSNFNTKYLIIALIVVIIVLVGVIGYFALNNGSGVGDASPKTSADSDKVQSNDNSNDKANDSSNDNSDSSKKTHESSSKTSSSSKSKKWVSIGRYSGSGSGSKTIKVPDGKIKVELSAYPILNYATNHLYVSGTNGESGGVDWGPTSDVETRSDSFKFTSKSEEEFTIDYYETVSWEVEFFRYQ
ncbi:zinc ribbon domain-containing protein [Methanobrevibacter sp. UBA212]|uniref:zinc ribbon domain-containing protein n=1 Tax=Methanobrevibacter sp. UBA212 TaxID=1915476 RepID=UPI0025FE7805|nr:zinc ribbon domain-containing protein [Methanobrevibacter sp. UBA212]